eukprot:4449400-Amphidinium_carterae.2
MAPYAPNKRNCTAKNQGKGDVFRSLRFISFNVRSLSNAEEGQQENGQLHAPRCSRVIGCSTQCHIGEHASGTARTPIAAASPQASAVLHEHITGASSDRSYYMEAPTVNTLFTTVLPNCLCSSNRGVTVEVH